MTHLRSASLACALSFLALPAASQEITLGLGVTDFSESGDDSAVFDFEYRHSSFFERRRFSAAFGVNASVSAEGDLFVGAGLWNRVQFDNGVFIDSSIMPGFYEEGTAGNDLGQTFEIRSLLGVGYKFDNGRAISAAIAHKSNAGLSDDNPGANSYSIRYHISF
ncbi:acyloxyacyl hydrolase [Tateyamaria sp.]|uniref:acyloxyacyl hydrolase n=1 Tax=Tateyamaria sp. TaxID=1929288 RepID=UPI00329BA0F1